MRARRLDDRGNIAVEFALVAPVFITLILGLVDYGIAAREVSTMRAAARAGLQALIADSDATTTAQTTAEAVAPDATVEVTVSCSCKDGATVACNGTCVAGGVRKIATVTVSRDLTLLIPWPTMEDPLPLQGIAQARIQ
ncbi:MAG: TadE/TadG family type IV pilus assembly protein [Solirubrobacterales bacterium]